MNPENVQKARLIPLYFEGKKDADFDLQVEALNTLLSAQADILSPAALGSVLPEGDAVVFPQMLGDAYRQVEFIRQINLPILIITSEFATVSMWDWEIASYLRSEGIDTIAPYNLEQAQMICRALGMKRDLQEAKFQVYQDNPGEGFQASIFKRFYWWEDECTDRMMQKFGIQLVKKSYRELASAAKSIPDAAAEEDLKNRQFRQEGVAPRALLNAEKLYLAVKQDLEQDRSIRAVGINCLNESHFSDTTPCLAWNLLYEEQGLLWGCEADTVSMLTEHIFHHALNAPVMMSNLYPFLMGQAALKHEHIPYFPEVPAPENCILVAHCGYFGLMPASFASDWALKPKVLAIVDDNATAIDARYPEGPITLVKLDSTMAKVSVIEGSLESYIQYTDSHCLNGAVVRVPDGRRLMRTLNSHHYIFIPGHHLEDIRMVSRVFGLEVEQI